MPEQYPWWLPAMKVFAQASAIIIGPLLVALFAGRWLDARYQTEPWLQLAALATAFGLTILGLLKLVRDYRQSSE